MLCGNENNMKNKESYDYLVYNRIMIEKYFREHFDKLVTQIYWFLSFFSHFIYRLNNGRKGKCGGNMKSPPLFLPFFIFDMKGERENSIGDNMKNRYPSSFSPIKHILRVFL
jgi:hypothetical protein